MGLWWGMEPFFHLLSWKKSAESRAATGGVAGQGRGAAVFYELLQNQESPSKRLPHLILTLPAVS